MRFNPGDTVKGHYSEGQWYLASIERDNGDNTYTLAWFDGDTANRVKRPDELKLMCYSHESQRFEEVVQIQRSEHGGEARIVDGPALDQGIARVGERDPGTADSAAGRRGGTDLDNSGHEARQGTPTEAGVDPNDSGRRQPNNHTDEAGRIPLSERTQDDDAAQEELLALMQREAEFMQNERCTAMEAEEETAAERDVDEAGDTGTPKATERAKEELCRDGPESCLVDDGGAMPQGKQDDFAARDRPRENLAAADAGAIQKVDSCDATSPFERASGGPTTEALEQPCPARMTDIYAEPLKFRVRGKEVNVRRGPSTESAIVGALGQDGRATGYPQGKWLKRYGPSTGWVLADGEKLGFGQLLVHDYLHVRILQTSPSSVLMEWDRLPGAKFVDYVVQWAKRSEPGVVVTAADHVPRNTVRVRDLPSREHVLLRVRACIYTETKKNGGERFATMTGGWQEAETVEEAHVEALEQPCAGLMPQIYSSPLEFSVRAPTRVHRSASTRTACVHTLRQGSAVTGYPQDNWFRLSGPCEGWLLAGECMPGPGQVLGHGYLRPRLLQSYSEAVSVGWDALPSARFVDYRLEWASASEPATVTAAADHVACNQALVHGLPPQAEVLVRVSACIYTESRANGGRHFATVQGDWLEAETDVEVDAVREELLCLDVLGNLRGKCTECPCGRFVSEKRAAEGRVSHSMDDLVCGRCGCSCKHHLIIGEYQTQRVKGATPFAFKLPARIKRAMESEAAGADLPGMALTDGASGASPPALANAPADTWRPADSDIDEDRVTFVLDRISRASTLYETLGVAPAADDGDIRRAHRNIALHIHPDKVMSRNEPDLVKQAEAAFKIVSAAYEVLGDEARRAAYDQTLRARQAPAGSAAAPRASRRDLVAATLIRRFFSKALWGWDLTAKPGGSWEEWGTGVYGRPGKLQLSLVHAITRERLEVVLDRQASLSAVKRQIVAEVKRGPASAIELATVDGEELQDDCLISLSQTLVLAGISSLGPPKTAKICLSHAHTGARHYIQVADTSTIAQVRGEAAKSLNVETLQVRLGYRWNNDDSFLNFDDSELLNGRTHILVSGVHISIQLSVEEATELQSELIEAYGATWFQAELDRLIQQYPPLEGLLDPRFNHSWGALLKKAQSNILLKHGFDGPQGAHTMVFAFQHVSHEPEVQRLGAEIDRQLRITYGTVLPPVSIVEVEPATAEDGGKAACALKVAVLPHYTIKQLKDAIRGKVGETAQDVEVGTAGQFGTFAAEDDSQQVGKRSKLKVLGVSSSVIEEVQRREEQQRRERERRGAEDAQKLPGEGPASPEPTEGGALRTCDQCGRRVRAALGHGLGGWGSCGWYCNACWYEWHTRFGNTSAAAAYKSAGGADAPAVPRKARSGPRCATPGCTYCVHSRDGMGPYCCLACKEGGRHGPACERVVWSKPLRPEAAPSGTKEAAEPAAAQAPRPPPTPLTNSTAPVRTYVELDSAELLRIQQLAGPAPAGPAELAGGQAEVEVRHSRDVAGGNVVVAVADGATWLDVRRELARKINRCEVLQHGRLVQKASDGAYSILDDSSVVDKSVQVLLLNAELSANPNTAGFTEADLRQAERRGRAQLTNEPCPAASKPKAREITEVPLQVKALRSPSKLDLTVLRTSTALDVREGIAYATGLPEEEVLAAKLLKWSQATGGYEAIQDDEIAGNKMTLHTMNLDLTVKKKSGVKQKKDAAVVAPCVLRERAARAEEAPLMLANHAASAKPGTEKEDSGRCEPGPVLVAITNATASTTPSQDGMTEVVVMGTSTLQDVLKALAVKVGRAEVEERGRFVERKNGASFKGLRSADLLGERRRLLYLGTSLQRQ